MQLYPNLHVKTCNVVAGEQRQFASSVKAGRLDSVYESRQRGRMEVCAMAYRVGVMGAAGFAGAELVRLLASHPSFELVVITSNADAGEPFSSVYPAYKGVTDLTFAAHDDSGRDCNWGRIAAALGKCGVAFDQDDVSINIMGMPVCREGLTVAFDEDEALRRFENTEITIWADLGAGTGSATVWTCDLAHDYVSINGDYRS